MSPIPAVFSIITIPLFASLSLALPSYSAHAKYHTRQKRSANEVFVNSKANANNTKDGVGRGIDEYYFYKGDGSECSGWPTMGEWVSFDDMWEANLFLIKQACSISGVDKNITENSPDETSQLRDAVQSVAGQSGVDHRFVLATIMQESHGCVRVHNTANAVVNPGLMQSHAGEHSCNNNILSAIINHTAVMTPCPKDQIVGMIMDGVRGTPSGAGLAGLLNQVRGDGGDAQTYYRAARQYNSGSMDSSRLEVGGSATSCYVTDIANRLTGWTSVASTCQA